MTFLDSEIESLLGEPLAALLFTCVGVPTYRNTAGGRPGKSGLRADPDSRRDANVVGSRPELRLPSSRHRPIQRPCNCAPDS